MRVPPRLRRPAPWLSVAGLAVLAAVLWRVFAEPEVYPPARVLRFPEEGYSGTLYLHEGVSEEDLSSQLPFGRARTARGTVEIPAETWAGLLIQSGFLNSGQGDPIRPIPDLAMLGAFKPNDLQYIEINSYNDPNSLDFAQIDLQDIKHLTGLRQLFLSGLDIGEGDLQSLKELPLLQKLEIYDSRATVADLNRLRAALPNCTINGIKGAPKPENRRPIG